MQQETLTIETFISLVIQASPSVSSMMLTAMSPYMTTSLFAGQYWQHFICHDDKP